MSSNKYIVVDWANNRIGNNWYTSFDDAYEFIDEVVKQQGGDEELYQEYHVVLYSEYKKTAL